MAELVFNRVIRFQGNTPAEFLKAYMTYVLTAGDALAAGATIQPGSVPPIFEHHRSSAAPFCIRAGPFYPDDHALLYNFMALKRLTLEVLEVVCQSTMDKESRDAYVGICADPEGAGSVTLFIWIPTLLCKRQDYERLRNLLSRHITGRQPRGAPPVFEDFSNPGKAAPAAGGGTITDSVLAASIEQGVCVSGGMHIPLLWCADPQRPAGESYPIIPAAYYGRYTPPAPPAQGEEALAVLEEGQGKIEFYQSLEGCLSPLSNAYFKEHLIGLKFTDLHEAESRDYHLCNELPLVREIASRPQGYASFTSYDCLPLVVALGFCIEPEPIAPGELPQNIFGDLMPDSPDYFNPEQLIRLFSADRFDLTTDKTRTTGAVLVKILEALVSVRPSSEDSERAVGLAIAQLEEAARSVGAKGFCSRTLAESYISRTGPPRSMRLLAHYARADNPRHFASLFSSRLWQKLYSVTDDKSTVPVAEALASYLMLDHFFVDDRGQSGQKIYRYEGPHYVDVGNPDSYIGSLLSSTDSCGKLYNLLGAYHRRLNALEASNASENGAPKLTLAGVKDRIGAISSIIKGLKQFPKLTSMVRAIISKIPQEMTFLRLNDRSLKDDPYIKGWKNGVTEVIMSEHRRRIVFRQGTPDDLLLYRGPASYRPSVRESAHWKTITRVFRNKFKDTETRRWILCQLAECFVTYNNKIFTYLIGPPDCGKSLFLDLFIIKFWGQDATTLPSNVMSDPRGGTDGPQDSLATAATCTAAVIEEMSQVIRNNIYKTTAGGEAQVNYRKLFKGAVPSRFGAKIFVGMNQAPHFEIHEKAIYTRSAFIYVSDRYPENPSEIPDTEEERDRRRIFPRDSSMQRKIRDAYDAYLLLLMDHFDKWDDKKGKPLSLSAFPPGMRENSKAVRARCPYATFANDRISSTENTLFFTTPQLIKAFRETNPSMSAVRDQAIQDAIASVLTSYPVNGNWYGFSICDKMAVPANRVQWESPLDQVYQGASIYHPENAERIFAAAASDYYDNEEDAPRYPQTSEPWDDEPDEDDEDGGPGEDENGGPDEDGNENDDANLDVDAIMAREEGID